MTTDILHGNYCVALSLPPTLHKPADYVLAGGLVLSPIWGSLIGSVNEYVSVIGGLIGITLGLIRIYRILFNPKKGDE